MIFLLFLSASLASPSSLALYRGASLPAPDNPAVVSRYWSAEDVTLWRSQPRMSDGQGEFLALSPETRVLIRFGDLERALGPNRRILRARLVLSVARIERVGTLTVRRFLGDWNEGAGLGRREDADLQWSTTWSYQFYNEKGPVRRWKNGGEEFLSREKSYESVVRDATGEMVIDGLEKDVEFFYHHWYENFGWALDFTGSALVISSQGERLRPRLEVEFETVGEKRGPDLSVIYISRQPEYERYDGLGLADLLRRGEVSAAELLEAALERIEWINPRINAVVTRMEAAARRFLEELPDGPFRGVPFLLKDLLSVCEGAPLTFGCRALRN
ncbi:MAG: hypothetical protein K6T17_07640, partial [Fimbriimonadales bacterium]|nr:hypothetical protein [Fimbriimonadales bacterium]